jgi:Golgi phosphoprotein 3
VTVGGGATKKRESNGVGRESVQELVREVRKEMAADSAGGAGAGGGQEEQEELCFEVIATVLEIFCRMDSLVSAQKICSGSNADVSAVIRDTRIEICCP